LSRPLDTIYDTVAIAQQAGEDVELSSFQRGLVEQANNAIKPLAPKDRFVDANATPPPGNLRIINGRVIERWVPVLARYAPGQKIPPVPGIIGYDVLQSRLLDGGSLCDCVGTKKLSADGTHAQCGRKYVNLKAFYDPEEQRPIGIAERVRSLHIQVDEDAIYNGSYPSLPGNDVAHHNPDARGMAAFQGGEIIRKPDGTPVRCKEIRHGRREHREATRHLEHVGSGTFAELDKNKRRFKEKAARELRERAERIAYAMPDTLGNI